MRLTTAFLFALSLTAGAEGFSQTVTLSMKNVPIQAVIKEISRQTGISMVYNESVFEGLPAISVDVRNVPLAEALDRCLRGLPVEYAIENDILYIRKKQAVALPVESGRTPPPADVHGRVISALGEPLANVNVVVKRTRGGTITNANGEFTLKNIRPDDELSISCIGYRTQVIKSIGDRSELSIRLEIANDQLDQAVVQGYGETSQRLTTSDIGRVSAEEIERQPVINPLLALQGKVAGLDITQTSGYASGPLKVELRGRATIGDFPSDPLYIIDGVPLTVVETGGNSSYEKGTTGFLQNGVITGPADGQSPLYSINPADIESIEVLKDADATSIYGSRGANGVILITTKRGKPGKTRFDFHVQEGVTEATRFFQLLNTQQYLVMRREAHVNDGFAPSISRGDYDMLLWDTTRYTNWEKAVYGGVGRTIDAQANVSGGDPRTTYRIGVSYNRTTDITTVSGADQRASVSVNLQNKSLDQRFSIGLSSMYSFAESDMIYMPSAITLPPDAPGIYDSLGNLNYAGWGAQNSSARRAFYGFQDLLQPYSAKTSFLNANLRLGYQLVKGLSLSSSFGYNTAQANQTYFQTIASQDPAIDPTGSAVFGNNSNRNWIIEPQLTYNLLTGKGKLNFLAGGTIQANYTEGLAVNASGYTNDALLKTVSNAPDAVTTDAYGEYRYAAVFGRLNYNWQDKYIVNISARRDGSSRFGPGKQFGDFASAGAAWIFSEENWVKEKLTFLSFGKIRASYGTTGSDAIGDYQYLSRWSSNGAIPYAGLSVIAPTQLSNPNFQWQVNKKLEAAIDLAFIRNRLHLTAAYYDDRCGDQLVSFPTPAFTGFTSVTANSPALVQNSGWEFLANLAIVDSRSVKWSVNFNGALNRNKLIAYPNLNLSPYASQYVIGQPLNILRLLHYTGVDPQTGHYTFEDKNHNGMVDVDLTGLTADDRYVYDLSPKFFGGFGTNVSYKGVLLVLFFNFRQQIGSNAYNQGDYPGRSVNQPVAVLDRWQKPGDVAPVASFTTLGRADLYYFKGYSDGAYTNASFVRLSNLAVSYSLPSALLKKTGIQGCNLFVHSNNLLVITKYKGLDPEVQNYKGLPPSRIIVGGISFNF